MLPNRALCWHFFNFLQHKELWTVIAIEYNPSGFNDAFSEGMCQQKAYLRSFMKNSLILLKKYCINLGFYWKSINLLINIMKLKNVRVFFPREFWISRERPFHALSGGKIVSTAMMGCICQQKACQHKAWWIV